MARSGLGAYSLVICLIGLGVAAPARAVTVVLNPDADTMLLSQDNTLSNGAGRHFCVGMTGEPFTRRGLVRFDIAGAGIPAGSTIDGVTLELYVNKAAPNGAGVFSVHRLTSDWGEGTSDAPAGECKGTTAQAGDATWDYTFFDPDDVGNSPAWATSGGDFGFASAALSLDGSDGYKAWSSLTLTADVQGWLDDPVSNFGWLVKRQTEVGVANALRFSSRQNNQSGQWPRLTIDYTPGAGDGACCFAGQVCQEGSSVDCSNQGGIFQGAGTDCSPNPCPPDPVGACCAATGFCSEVTQAVCEGQGDTYQGDGVQCSALECPIVLEPFVDALPLPAVADPVTGSAGGAASYEIAMRETNQQLHRDLPQTTIWGYGDGPSGATYPGPTIEARTGQPVTVTWINDLRDISSIGEPLRTDHYLTVPGLEAEPGCQIHGAEDAAKTVVHLHGGHVPAEVDGYPEDTFLPGNQVVYEYPNDQPATTLWFHDHALGITRLNVTMGLAAFYLIRDDFEDALGLPDCPGPGDPGTCFEIPLVIQDRSFNPDGSWKYPEEFQDQFYGDKLLVNGKVWPYLDVNQGKYRFRVLNGSNSRTYTLSLDRQDLPGEADLDFVQIGTGGGLIELPLTSSEITLGPAERADVIVDFETIPAGTEILLKNTAPAPYPGTPGVGVIPDVMKLVVQDAAGFTGVVPVTLRPLEVLDEGNAVKVRDFVLDTEPDACGTIWKINGLGWDDVTEYPTLGTTEIWRFINPRDIMHPMHTHLSFFQVLDREPVGGGAPVAPEPNEIAWKDTARAEANTITRVAIRFEDYSGLYAYHCHILEHEDHEMMRQFWAVEALSLEMDETELAWPAQPGAIGYDVVRGDLGQLRATDGNFAFGSVTQTCLAEDHPSTTLTDTDTPVGSGEGFWYLLRAVDAGGNGTYDTGAASQVDQRDDEIASSGNDCM